MPAVMVENPLVLPRIPRPYAGRTTDRPVTRMVTAATGGGGFRDLAPVPGSGLARLGIIPADQMAPPKYS